MIRMGPLNGGRQGVVVEVEDSGPGIANFEQILAGDYVSETGMGLGLVGSKRLMDEFSVQSGPGKW